MDLSAIAAAAGATGAVLVALVLLRAAWHKGAEFAAFTGFAADYRLLPERLVAPVSAALLGAEAICVALVLVPATRSAGALAAAALFLAYAAAMAINILRGHTAIECGCGGAPQVISPATLARNGVLAAVALGVAVAPSAALDGVGTVAAVTGGLSLFIAYVAVEQVLSNDGRIGSHL